MRHTTKTSTSYGGRGCPSLPSFPISGLSLIQDLFAFPQRAPAAVRQSNEFEDADFFRWEKNAPVVSIIYCECTFMASIVLYAPPAPAGGAYRTNLQPKSNWVHFSRKSWHLVATYSNNFCENQLTKFRAVYKEKYNMDNTKPLTQEIRSVRGKAHPKLKAFGRNQVIIQSTASKQ